jgi:tetratricopeptide (TPR) repeat protein
MQIEVPKNSPALSYELVAREKWASGNFSESLPHVFDWQRDQPFSVQPAIAGSYIASVILQDYRGALSFVREGLNSNPNEFMLLNNYAYTLCRQGNTALAQATLMKAKEQMRHDREIATWHATHGLLLIKTGLIAQGMVEYESSVETFRRQMDDATYALALMFYSEAISEISDPLPKPFKARLTKAWDTSGKITQSKRNLLLSCVRERMEKNVLRQLAEDSADQS